MWPFRTERVLCKWDKVEAEQKNERTSLSTEGVIAARNGGRTSEHFEAERAFKFRFGMSNGSLMLHTPSCPFNATLTPFAVAIRARNSESKLNLLSCLLFR